MTVTNGKIETAQFAMGGVGTRPWRNTDAEKQLVGQAPGKETFHAAAEAFLTDARPQSQNGFKIELAKRCLVHTLDAAAKLA
jgi:xanthine dehydrogenase YagS FAD-binding subunit